MEKTSCGSGYKRKPDFVGSFTYRGRERIHHIDVEWFDLSSKTEMPEVQWQQVYIIGDLDGKVPMVQYPNDPDNLPGGRSEPGETAEQTAIREAEEELNCRVVSWEPIGYQSCSEAGEHKGYQLRVFAKLEKIGEFEKDPGGPVIGYRLVEIDDLATNLNWPDTGERIQRLAKKYFD